MIELKRPKLKRPELKRIIALIGYWWRKDRIRVAPGESRVLRMRPGNYVRIEDRLYEIISRRPHSSAAGPCLDYRCRPAQDYGDEYEDKNGYISLTAGPVRPGQTCRIEIDDGASRRELMADEVQVYERLKDPFSKTQPGHRL